MEPPLLMLTPNRPRSPAIPRRGGLFAVLVLAALPCLAEPPAGAGAARDWSYQGAQGPAHWSELSPDFARCTQGLLQSPIDIRTANRVPYKPLVFKYQSQSLDAHNHGRGVYLVSAPGSRLQVDGHEYDLLEVRFHVPGEHLVNGVQADAEIQFVHRDAAGQTLVVAAPVRAGRRVNSVLARILERLPMDPGGRVTLRRLGVNPLFLLPSQRDYFTYVGSETVPPCREPVTWILLAHPVEVHAEQVELLARATGQNARPAQPLNDRPVYGVLRH